MISMDVHSASFTNLVAQLGHFGWGALMSLATDLFEANKWFGVIIVLSWAIPKEFVWDIVVEHQTVGDGFFDLSMYCAGIGLAFLILWLKKKYAG